MAEHIVELLLLFCTIAALASTRTLILAIRLLIAE
jgi:hypothetical protein